jgi:hypothetical protein
MREIGLGDVFDAPAVTEPLPRTFFAAPADKAQNLDTISVLKGALRK